MRDRKDILSLYFGRAIDMLFMKQGQRTSLGFVLGVALHGLVSLFGPTFARQTWLAIDKLGMWHLVSFGILTCHAPILFHVARHRPIVNEQIDDALRLIEHLRKEGKLSELEARQEFRKLSEKVLDEVVLSQRTQEQVQAFRRPEPNTRREE